MGVHSLGGQEPAVRDVVDQTVVEPVVLVAQIEKVQVDEASQRPRDVDEIPLRQERRVRRAESLSGDRRRGEQRAVIGAELVEPRAERALERQG